ncbi:SRPBCC family protein [Paramicrobacterium chengjingii]|uniref:SRPBCC family protein n=1 Tax=Paramicrobacterium chengjingii TaxID=2769067 RepID=UPI00142039DF|nr:SRPBCC family protein [Microbacterium chengjingii]
MTSTTSAPTTAQVYQIFIKATPEQIWDAITQPEFSSKYFYGSRVETKAEVGTPFRYHASDGSSLWGDETVLESDKPNRLVVGWRSLYDPSLADEPSSRVTWDIQLQEGGFSLLTVTHDRLENAPRTAANVAGAGWMMVLSGLKTVLETGSGLTRS